MERNDLFLSAQKLSQVPEQWADEYSAKREMLVNKMNLKMEARPDLFDMVGETNVEMMKDNHANHARFLESISTSIHQTFWLILFCGFSGHTAPANLILPIGLHSSTHG